MNDITFLFWADVDINHFTSEFVVKTKLLSSNVPFLKAFTYSA
jgi:hypothetical protein